jgi:hypothetical protein
MSGGCWLMGAERYKVSIAAFIMKMGDDKCGMDIANC